MITATSEFLTANEQLVKEPVFLIEIDGYDKVFTNKETGVSGQVAWITDIQDLQTTVADLDGGADLGSLTFSVMDFSYLITADFPDFVFEGKQVTLKTGFVGLAQDKFVTLFTGRIDQVDSANNNLEYQFNCVDMNIALTQTIFLTGDDGLPTSSDHKLTLTGHPLDLLLDILQVELGLININIDKIIDYRDGAYAGIEFQFHLDTAPVAKDFIENELLKPIGAYIWTNADGQVDVNFFYRSTADPVATITNDDLEDVPTAMQSPLVNVVQFRFDKDPEGSDFFAELVSQSTRSVNRYGQFGPTTIEASGLRSSFQGFFQAALTSQLIFFRYGFKNLRFEEFPLTWVSCILEPGDLIAVTCPFVPNREAGTIGIIERLFEVTDRTLSFMDGKVSLTLIDADYLLRFGTFRITPNIQPNYADDSPVNRARYMYLCNDSDVYTTADPGNTLGLVTQ